MQVVSEGTFAVASVLWQPTGGRHALTVVCKATYALRPAVSPLAKRQEPPCAEDQFSRSPVRSSLYAVSDLVPGRPRADVLLVGRACAPAGQPTRRVMTRLAVGDEVDKRVEVFAHRYYEPSGKLCWGPRFVRMSLWYERAAGGQGTDNPVGIRTARRRDDGRVYLPNLQPPGLGTPQPGVAVPTASYGPIAPAWPVRRRLLSALATPWDPEAWWEQPLPQAVDPGFFNTAPADQQLRRLRADQRLRLENLLPRLPTLDTRLCGVRPRALVRRAGGRTTALDLVADTLWVDTVREIATLVWRGRLDPVEPAEEGTVEISRDPRRRLLRPSPPRPPAPPRRLEVEPSPVASEAFEPDDTSPTLPREPIPPSTPPSPAPPSAEWLPSGEPSSRWGFEPTAVLPAEWATSAAPSWTRPMSPEEVSYERLPGVVPSGGWTPQQLLEEADDAETMPDAATAEAVMSETVTLTGPVPVPVDPLPFKPAAPPGSHAPTPSESASREPPAAALQPHPGQPPATPPWVRPTPVEALGRVQELRQRRLGPSPWAGEGRPARRSSPSPRKPPGEPAPLPPEPPLLGPLATYEMLGGGEPSSGDDDAPIEQPAPPAGSDDEAVPPAAPPAPPESAAAPPEPAPELPESPESASPGAAPEGEVSAEPPPPSAEEPAMLPVEQCAAIAASIDRRPAERDEILDEQQLEPEPWALVAAHWRDAISAETAKGRSTLLRAYDAAYVARLEEERGPLEPFEYARLVVAAETGDAGDVLAALELPRGALLRIDRVMAQRMADSAALAKKIRKAIQAARKR